MSPTQVFLLMFGLLMVLVVTGFPLAFCIGGVGLIVGFIAMGPTMFNLMYTRAYGALTDYTMLAVPLFIFMGVMVEKSGVAAGLFNTLHLLMGRVKGSMAMVTILTGAIIAATIGVFSASIVMLGMIALPAMLKADYDKQLACGSVIAGGCLGILIPPSIMLVLYGPMAGLSVGRLFMGAFGAGIGLTVLYIVYIAVRSLLQPGFAPSPNAEELAVPWKVKIRLMFTTLIPPVFLILAVLGSIFFGVAAPTEAAAVGALASMVMAAAYRKLNRPIMAEAMTTTLKVSAFIIMLVIGASIFTGTFLTLGGGEVVKDFVMAAPFGRWGALAIIMFTIFVLGMFLDWIGILLILVPLVTPIAAELGFQPIWFAMMICVNLQMAYMTPPFAPAIFFLRGVVPADSGIDTALIIRSVMPMVGLVILFLIICIAIPEIITFLPDHMIR